ncbi:MAG: protein kinase [Cellvibrionaceae bacterium]|nr:protein kinase [Cellvibrionaceae bacterium]
MARKKLKKPNKLGQWKVRGRIAAGGNGTVYHARSERLGKGYVVKTLDALGKEREARFKAEVGFLEGYKEIEGVVPIVDSGSHEGRKWYVMPYAEAFYTWRSGKSPLDILKGFIPLAETLSDLHKKGVCHRDIKPANLLFYKERLCLTDFGLVKYPSREDITPIKSDVGPKFTMAPEMRRYASEADGFKADIYSFAKTLWIAITGDSLAFDGVYVAEGILGISVHCPDIYAKPIDDLLRICTNSDPLLRPDAEGLIESLKEVVALNEDFFRRNLTEWFEIQSILFPRSMPSSVVWRDRQTICEVLNQLGERDSLNHLFFPDGGGHVFLKAEQAEESGCISLKLGDGSVYVILKPEKLSFESFGVDPEWNYFRLELASLEYQVESPGAGSDKYCEEVVELTPGSYISLNCWWGNEYQGMPLPEESRRVCRYLKGCFVMFSTASVYNQTPDTYDARHEQYSESEFREHIRSAAEYFDKRKAESLAL